MRSMIAALVAVAALFACSLAAAAQDRDGPDYARAGFYMGIGLEGAVYTNVTDDLENELRALGYVVSADIGHSVGFNLYGGYRAHPNFALEAEFGMQPAKDLELSDTVIAELETWAFTGNAKIFPLTGQFQPFGLVGVGVLHGKIEDKVGAGLGESESDFVARFGGGADIYLTEWVALTARATYVLPTGDVDGLDYVSFGVGFQIRF